MTTCFNCGGEVPSGARFCPRCAAPVRDDLDLPEPPEPPEDIQPRRRRWQRSLLVLAVAVGVASLVLAVLVIVFGVFVEPSTP